MFSLRGDDKLNGSDDLNCLFLNAYGRFESQVHRATHSGPVEQRVIRRNNSFYHHTVGWGGVVVRCDQAVSRQN